MHEQGVDDFSQAARIGPDGVVIGPDKAGSEVNHAADQALGNFGIKNIKFGLDGVQINEGNRLNSSVTVPLFTLQCIETYYNACDNAYHPWIAAMATGRDAGYKCGSHGVIPEV